MRQFHKNVCVTLLLVLGGMLLAAQEQQQQKYSADDTYQPILDRFYEDENDDALIEAYENTYGSFTPLETKPDGVVADSEYLRWVIPHLEVSEETDEYYEFPVIFPFRVDKRTGGIFKHYNGIDPFTVPFDPHAPDALAFAG